uniref:Uncharacterized protein n=1 Tax=Panstrongylus lignarius TaxID=156445 RepID=A0A224Y3J6_9HEMI
MMHVFMCPLILFLVMTFFFSILTSNCDIFRVASLFHKNKMMDLSYSEVMFCFVTLLRIVLIENHCITVSFTYNSLDH